MEREHAVRLYQKITLDIINRLDDTSKSRTKATKNRYSRFDYLRTLKYSLVCLQVEAASRKKNK